MHRGQLTVPGHNCWRQFRNVIYMSNLNNQVEACQVGVVSEILNVKVAFRLIHTSSAFVTPLIKLRFRYPLVFSFQTENRENKKMQMKKENK